MHLPLDAYSTVTYHPPIAPPSAAGSASDNHDEVEIRSAVDYPRQPVEWLWPGKIPIGKVTLLVGDPGLGKSLVAIDVASRVTRGASWPETARGRVSPRLDADGSLGETAPRAGSVIILSAEDGIADTIRPRLDAHGADPNRVFFLPTLSDLRHDLGKLEAALKRLPDCRLIVVDPVNACVGASD